MDRNDKIIVVGLGEVLYDHDVRVGSYTFGGAPANFADHFRKCADRLFGEQNPVEVHLVSAVGVDADNQPDEWGGEVLRELRERSLMADISRVGELPTGLVDKLSDANGVNTYKILRGAWDRIAWSDSLERLARQTRVVCFGSLAQRDAVTRATIRRFLDCMPEASMRVFDINIRQNYYSRPVLQDSIVRCSVLKISDEEAPKVFRCLSGFDMACDAGAFCQALLGRYANLRMVILTEGADGSRIFTRERISGYVIPKQGRCKVVDTVGAGDSFTAALCAMLLRGADLWTAQCRASKVAAFVCGQRSATPDYPDDLLVEQPVEKFGL